MKLLDLMRQYYSVSIIGMCKNAGKTTVLNRIITEMAEEGICFAITSIGRDGEGSDVVWHAQAGDIRPCGHSCCYGVRYAQIL